MEIIIPEDQSVLKLHLETSNPRDNLHAFLYDSQNHTKLLAWTQPDFDYNTLWVSLNPSKKAYLLKLIFDTIDQSERLPNYYLRIAIVSQEDIINDEEIVACIKDYENPPKSIDLSSLST
jgi:hypothetical protein